MSIARQLAVVSAILLSSGLATPARANNLGLTGIVSGGTLWWQGNAANTNVFGINRGSCMINGSPMLPIIGQVITTQGGGANAVFDVAAGQGGDYANSAVFYVYYMAYNNNLLYQPVISHTWPRPEGYPAAGLTYTPPGQPQQVNSQTGVFLGSYLTDGQNMIPFRRHGDEVILEGDFASQPSCFFHFDPQDAYPSVKTQTCTWAIPMSAEAAIVNALIQAPDANYRVAILEPGIPTIVQDAFFVQHYHAQVQVDATTANGMFAIVNDARVFMPGGVVTAGAPWGPPKTFIALYLYYRGYVEVPHHM